MDAQKDRLYRSFSSFLHETFGERVYKVSIDAGFTCPNRDGTLGVGGCGYCNNQGFSHNTRAASRPVREQVLGGIEYMSRRYKAKKFIAYFQAFTNTYAPVEELRALYDEALALDDVIGLSVGTRPDCVDDEKLEVSRDRAVGDSAGSEDYISAPADLERARQETSQAYKMGSVLL